MRAVSRGPSGEGFHSLSAPGLSDPDGQLVLEVEEPLPGAAWLELASFGALGFRHGFLPFADLKPSAPGGPVLARLPEGGPLRVELVGLPAEARPPSVDLQFLPPYGPWLPLFRDVTVLPSEDGGVFEVRPQWRGLHLRLGEDGAGTMPHVATDHAVLIDVPALPEGWILEGSTSTGPFEAMREGDVVRVPDPAGCTYVARFRPAPAARITVGAVEGGALPSARVAAGLRHADGTPEILGSGVKTDVTGVAVVPLWAGRRLPEWVPTEVLLLAWAPGRLARVVTRPGRWSDVEATIELAIAPPGRFRVEGVLRHADGRPAPGLPVRLAAALPWNGHAVADPFEAWTDGEGHFQFEVPESVRPLLAVRGRLRVALDPERLEAMATDAYWRSRWPSLPRMLPVPADFELPPPDGTARVELQLTLP